MDRVGNDLVQGRAPKQPPQSVNRVVPDSRVPNASSPGFRSLAATTDAVLWSETWPTLDDPLPRPFQSMTEDNSPHHRRAGILPRHHYSSSPRGPQAAQATITSDTAHGGERRRSETETTPRPERRNTKRRRTGPERFDNYLHGEMRLPLDATTTDVFKKYPNHITDEDIEECWRLGLSARQISEMMPEDTQFNSDGVHVQQHHSLIQKKFKTYKDRHEKRLQTMRDRLAQSEGQDLLRFPTMEANRAREGRNNGPNTGRNAPPSAAGASIELPDLSFRYYSFNPANDQAFEARMSIELAKVEPLSGHPADEDHEIRVISLLIKQEIQRHGNLLKRLFIQTHPSTGDFDTHTYPNRETEGHEYQQRLLAYADAQRASLYRESGMHLSQQSGIPWNHTPDDTTTFPDALRLLQLIIDRIYFQCPVNSPPVSPKRPLFNVEHTNLRKWRVLARLLYYMASLTRNLEDVASANAARTQAASSMTQPRPPRHFQEAQARSWSQAMTASDDEPRPMVGSSPLRHLPTMPFHREATAAADQQPPYAAFDPITRTEPADRPQARTYFDVTSSPTSVLIPSPSERGITVYEGIGPLPVNTTRSAYQPPVTGPATRSLRDHNEPRSAFIGGRPEQTTFGTNSRPFPTSARPPQTPRHTALSFPAPNATTSPSVGLVPTSPTTEPAMAGNAVRSVPPELLAGSSGLEKTRHRFDAPKVVGQDDFSTPEAPPAIPPSTDSIPAQLPATADEVRDEMKDYISFPGKSYENYP